MCFPLTRPMNALIIYSPDTTYGYHTRATYKCIDGFGLSDTCSDSTRLCVASSSGGGTWNGTAPTCESEW